MVRDLADMAAQLGSLQGEVNALLSDESYDALTQAGGCACGGRSGPDRGVAQGTFKLERWLIGEGME